MGVPLYPAQPPVYLVVAARDFPGKFRKGDIVEVLANGNLKSDWCVPPDFIWVTITDKSKNQVNVYLSNWAINFVHNLINQNNDGWRYRIEVDPQYISASEVNKNSIKQGMIDYLNANSDDWSSLWYKSSINSWTSNSITIDIPKPIQGNPAYEGLDPEWILMYESMWSSFLQEVKYDFHDKFADILDIRRYYFKSASVDHVVSNLNGEWSGTHTEALNHIVDKLSE